MVFEDIQNERVEERKKERKLFSSKDYVYTKLTEIIEERLGINNNVYIKIKMMEENKILFKLLQYNRWNSQIQLIQRTFLSLTFFKLKTNDSES